jgi:hypothetical protein
MDTEPKSNLRSLLEQLSQSVTIFYHASHRGISELFSSVQAGKRATGSFDWLSHHSRAEKGLRRSRFDRTKRGVFGSMTETKGIMSNGSVLVVTIA